MALAKHHIVVVEDEPVTRALFSAYLERAGYRVTPVESGAELRAALPADLVLLDIELPGEDGFVLARELRAGSRIPIIIVTHRVDAVDRVVGLELGADDYVVKPPDMRELLARVKNLLWRAQTPTPAPEKAPLRFGDWVLDRARQSLIAVSGAEVPLTLAELRVVGALVAARGAIVPRDALIEAIRSDRGDSNDAIPGDSERSRSLDVITNRLRRKLGEGGLVTARIILTVHGVGYRIGVPID